MAMFKLSSWNWVRSKVIECKSMWWQQLIANTQIVIHSHNLIRRILEAKTDLFTVYRNQWETPDEIERIWMIYWSQALCTNSHEYTKICKSLDTLPFTIGSSWKKFIFKTNKGIENKITKGKESNSTNSITCNVKILIFNIKVWKFRFTSRSSVTQNFFLNKLFIRRNEPSCSCLHAPTKGASPNGWSSSNLLCLPPSSGQWRFWSWGGRGFSLLCRPVLSVVCPSDVSSRAVICHGALVMCRIAGPVSRHDRTSQGDAW